MKHRIAMKYVAFQLAALVFLWCPGYSGVLGLEASSSANDLMKAVVANELVDRLEHLRWMHHVTKTVEQQTLTQLEVETKDGPVHRLLAINEKPLDSAQGQQETVRQEQLTRDPSRQLAVKKQNDADELRLEAFVRLLPSAFLFEYDGLERPDLRLKFRPNPGFVPPTMESRALQSMTGTILIDPQQKRLAHLSGLLVQAVNFGFGILGRIESGGTFEIARTQVSSSHWKTSLVDIDVSGRMLLFKTTSKQQHEARSDFEWVSQDLDLKQAERLLQSRPN